MYVVRVFVRSEYLKLLMVRCNAASLTSLFPFFVGCKVGVNRFQRWVIFVR
jgi:hypothetical protein